MSTSILPVSSSSGFLYRVRDMGPHGILDELTRSPYFARAISGRNSYFQRRLRATTPLACIGAIFALLLAGPAYWGTPSALGLEMYLPIRLLLLYRAASHAVAAVRRDLDAGNLTHLVVSPLSGRDLTLGWAMVGWSRSIPESIAALLFLTPLALAWGPIGAVIACVELGHLLLLQALAAIVAAGLMAGFQHRHEAATAGWLSAVFTYPLVFMMQTMVMGLLFAMLPLAVLLMLGTSLPAGWPEVETAVILESALWLMAGVYAIWMPIAIFREIDRQLDLANEAATPGLQRYLQAGWIAARTGE